MLIQHKFCYDDVLIIRCKTWANDRITPHILFASNCLTWHNIDNFENYKKEEYLEQYVSCCFYLIFVLRYMCGPIVVTSSSTYNYGIWIKLTIVLST